MVPRPVTAPESVEQAGPSECVDTRDNQLDEVVTPVVQISEASASVDIMETNHNLIMIEFYFLISL